MNFSNDISMFITAQRAASTPKDLDQSLCLRFKKITLNSPINDKISLNYSGCDGSPLIFGRLNLQLSNACAQGRKKFQSIQSFPSPFEYKKATVNIREDFNVKHSNNCLTNEDWETQDTKNEESGRRSKYGMGVPFGVVEEELIDASSNNNSCSRNALRPKFRISSIYSKPKKRRSNNGNENELPVLKVTPKCPKSPRLLTAMRSKLKQNRDRIRRENEKIGIFDRKHFQPIKRQDFKYKDKENAKNSAILPKPNKASTFPMSRNANKQSEPHPTTKRQPLKTLCQNKEIIRQTKKKDGDEKFTPFKAQPIRKYAPLPVVKTRSLTVPRSPKLGKRRLNAVSR